jgi:hypothetical protein
LAALAEAVAQKLQALGYDREAAVKYAETWAYYFNPLYYHYGADCTNFASQILFAGGISMTDQWHSGTLGFNFGNILGLTSPYGVMLMSYAAYSNVYQNWLYYWDNTSAWSVGNEHYNYFSDPTNGYINGQPITVTMYNVAQVAYTGGIQPGDLLYFDHDRNGIMDHAAIVSRVEANDILYTAHTESRFDESLMSRIGDEKAKVVKIRD